MTDGEAGRTLPRKRSVMIAGHATSVSMEQAFWDMLTGFAEERGVSVNALVSEIDRDREANLSSAIRVWVLMECARRAGNSLSGC
ncbi:MAG: ribbon-helix-helix domain-containing protein [Alphaproteobacteria bacterium]|nr:ribbon-helix-helix domain-containing protein [Alphaproteobacteria bacterium]